MGHFLLLLWWWPSLDFHWSVLYPCISLHICIERIFEPLFTKYVWVKSQILSKDTIGQQTKKLICLVLATWDLRNYSGEKFFLWILRFVGVWNICKNPRKYRNRVCLIFFPPQNYENKYQCHFWYDIFLILRTYICLYY